MKIIAYQAYRKPDLPIAFWRTSAGQEVDFILGDKTLALEIKGSSRVHEGDLRSLAALREDGPVKKCAVVCLEKEPRTVARSIEILPWRMFLEKLWGGELDAQ
jgi:predicted AAA+ superfamily ATPase